MMIEAYITENIEHLTEIDTFKEYHKDKVKVQGFIDYENINDWIKDDYRIIRFSFEKWGIVGGEFQDNKLIILRSVDWDYDFSKDFKKFSIQEFEVYLSLDKTYAIFIKSLDVSDPRNELISLQNKKEGNIIFIPTKKFGTLIYSENIEDDYQSFDPKPEWKSNIVSLNMEDSDDNNYIKFLDVAETLWSNQDEWQNKIEHMLLEKVFADDLFIEDEDYNEIPVSKDEFLKIITLKEISVNEDGSFSFLFDDGWLFGGHDIFVFGSLKKGLDDAYWG